MFLVEVENEMVIIFIVRVDLLFFCYLLKLVSLE